MKTINTKILFICLLILVCLPINGFSSSGLKETIILKYFKHEYVPKQRKIFKSQGQIDSFRERSMNALRNKLTPMLEPLENVFQFSKKNDVPYVAYNYSYASTNINEENLETLLNLKYPHNLTWKINSSNKKGIEFITLSFDKKPTIKQFKDTISSIENVFKMKIEKKEIKSTKKIRLTKKEREMLEPIRKKDFIVLKYTKYYGIMYRSNTMVQANYTRDYKNIIEDNFANIHQQFKSEFSKSKKINYAVTSEILKELEEYIEEQDFKSLNEPFLMASNFLPEDLQRISIIKEDFNLVIVIHTSKKMNELNQAINKILSKL